MGLFYNLATRKDDKTDGTIYPEQLKGFRKKTNELIDKLRTEIKQNITADHPQVVQLARSLKELSEAFAEPDPEVDKAVERFHLEDPDEKQHGMDLKLYQLKEWIQR
jgi:hypothetical protein